MMNTKSVTKVKWFWAWQDEKEEAWLAQMANQGFHLESLPFPTVYRFRVGTPAEVVYRLDFPYLRSKDRDSYLQLFTDSGWEHVGDMGGWVYFRKSVLPGEPTEIFTDPGSKIQKYQRVMMYLVIFLPMIIVIRPRIPAEGATLLQNMIFFLFTGFMLLWAAAIVSLIRRINQLKNTEA